MLLASLDVRAGAADVMFGVAANINAMSPMVMAGIQSSADMAIARINGQTSIGVTRINSETSKYLADLQMETSFSQLATTWNINALNQTAATDRLALQLRELSAARQDNLSLTREKMGMEWTFNLQRILLAYRQADDNAQLARIALSAQLVQAGLSTDAPAASSASKIEVSRVIQKRDSSLGSISSARLSMVKRAVSSGEVTGSSRLQPLVRPLAVRASKTRDLAGTWIKRPSENDGPRSIPFER